MKACNQLLRSWEQFKKLKHRFGSLQRIGCGYVEGATMPPRPKLTGSRKKRRAS